MFCPECGKQIKDGVKFCPKCGKKIPEEASEQKTVPEKEQKPPTIQAKHEVESPQPGLPSEQQPRPQPKQKSKAVPILIVLILVVLAVGISTIIYVNSLGNRRTDSSAADAREETEEELDDEDEKGTAAESTEESLAAATEAQTLEEPTEPARSRNTVATTVAVVQEKPVGNLVDISLADFSGLSKVVIQKENVTQSSHVVQSDTNIDNTGWSAFDGRAETSWQEGRADDGVNEYVSAQFDQTYEVKTLTFLLGNHRSQSWFERNNRPKMLRLELGGQTYSVEFPDVMTEYAVVFSEPISADSITVYIGEVYPGTEYRDTVIAEIGVYRN